MEISKAAFRTTREPGPLETGVDRNSLNSLRSCPPNRCLPYVGWDGDFHRYREAAIAECEFDRSG